MSGKYLLDTNIIIALFKNDGGVRNKLSSSPEIFVPVIAIGELYYGAQNSGQVERNTAHVLKFARDSAVLPCDSSTADFYGQIKNQLKAKGQPLPENDIWIAAIAQQHSLRLVTRDKHFESVGGLLLESW